MTPGIKYAEDASPHGLGLPCRPVWLRALLPIVVLLVALLGCRRGVDPSVVDPYDALREKLQTIVSVDWDDVPLETALRELTEQHGLSLTMDMPALEAEWARFVVERDLAAGITLRLRDVRLRSVLHAILDNGYMRYVPGDGGIVVTSKKVADTSLISRPYPVGDITRQRESLDKEKLAEMITGTIRPDGWEPAGPRKMETRPGALFIQQAWDAHELRTPLDGSTPLAPSQRAPAIAAIYKTLDARVTIDLNSAPAAIVHDLASKYGINVVVKYRKIEELNSVEEFTSSARADNAEPMVMTDIPWRTALDLILEPLVLDWGVRDDALVITPSDKTNPILDVRCYPALAGVHTDTLYETPGIYDVGTFSPGHSVSELDECLQQFVAPNSWKDNGGSGSYGMVPHGIVVAQTERGHGELANWLSQLRRASDPRVVDYDEQATSPHAGRLWHALEQPVTIDLNGPDRIGRGIRELLVRHGVPNVIIDFKRLEEANVRPSDFLPIVHVRNVSLAAGLDLLLDPLGLGWYTRDNVLIVTSKEKVDATMVSLAYRCPCLPRGGAEEMIDVATQHIRPDSWKEAGGPGNQAFVLGNVLSVSQSCSVHRQLRRYLRQWHAAQDVAAPPSLAVSPTEQRIYEALERSITFNGKEQPLMAAVVEFAQRCGVENVIWDWNSIGNHEDDRLESKLRAGELRATITAADQTAGEVLKGALETHKLSWTIEHDALCVRYEQSPADPAMLVTGFYRVPKAVTRAIGDNPETLTEMITTHFEPESWKNGGGPGSINLVSGGRAAGNLLVVSQPWAMQRRLPFFLRQWEALLDRSHNLTAVLALSPAEQRLHEALARRITFSCADRPLTAAVAELSARAGVKNVCWDWRAIEAQVADGAMGEGDYGPLGKGDFYGDLRGGKVHATLQAGDEPAGDALARLLQPYGLSWTFKHDALCVTCEKEQPQLMTGVYRLPQNVATVVAAFAPLVPDPDPPPAQAPNPAMLPSPSIHLSPPDRPTLPAEDLLRECLMELLPPEDGWNDNRGPGGLTIVSLPRGEGLAVVMTHTMSLHRQAKKLFDGWQKTPKLPDEITKLLKLPRIENPARRRPPRKPPLSGGFFRISGGAKALAGGACW